MSYLFFSALRRRASESEPVAGSSEALALDGPMESVTGYWQVVVSTDLT
jgi:hypothetical protein